MATYIIFTTTAHIWQPTICYLPLFGRSRSGRTFRLVFSSHCHFLELNSYLLDPEAAAIPFEARGLLPTVLNPKAQDSYSGYVIIFVCLSFTKTGYGKVLTNFIYACANGQLTCDKKDSKNYQTDLKNEQNN